MCAPSLSCCSAWPKPQQCTMSLSSAQNLHEGPGILLDLWCLLCYTLSVALCLSHFFCYILSATLFPSHFFFVTNCLSHMSAKRPLLEQGNYTPSIGATHPGIIFLKICNGVTIDNRHVQCIASVVLLKRGLQSCKRITWKISSCYFDILHLRQSMMSLLHGPSVFGVLIMIWLLYGPSVCAVHFLLWFLHGHSVCAVLVMLWLLHGPSVCRVLVMIWLLHGLSVCAVHFILWFLHGRSVWSVLVMMWLLHCPYVCAVLVMM